ncbi:MAG: HigA family addiction module antitoxin [Gammaproteobacteria bacterium]|jgi:addiction module HigA family antidote
MDEYRFHPGTYLRELLIWHDMSAEQLAQEMQLPGHAIVDLTRARRSVDRATSERLADYFGNSAQFWLDLQRGFDRCDREAE